MTTTLFVVRPTRFNVGNEAIFLGVRHLLREAFGERLNIVAVSAMDDGEPGWPGGLRARAVHEMNLYGHGIVVGGGNLYENGQLAIDLPSLHAMRPPLMLFSLSHGRIYDNRHRLVSRTDAMPDAVIRALNEKAEMSVARDEATFAYLRSLGVAKAVLGGCPSLLLSEIAIPELDPSSSTRSGVLLSIRHPQLMSIPLGVQGKLHATILAIISSLEAEGWGPVRILCHDSRDIAFAASLGSVDFVISDNVYAHLALLRSAALVVTFRLHAFLPCMSFGTPAINISYDERSASLVRTIGLDKWDIDLVRSADVVSEVRDRARHLADLERLRIEARPKWDALARAMREQMTGFAARVREYAAA